MVLSSFFFLLSVLLKNEETPQLVSLALQGFNVSIQVASRFDLVSEVELYVSSLAKFTEMTFSATGGVETPLSLKNVKALQVRRFFPLYRTMVDLWFVCLG